MEHFGASPSHEVGWRILTLPGCLDFSSTFLIQSMSTPLRWGEGKGENSNKESLALLNLNRPQGNHHVDNNGKFKFCFFLFESLHHERNSNKKLL